MSVGKISFNDLNMELTKEEMLELENAERMESVFDEDAPEMTHEQLMHFKRINHVNHENRKNS